MSAVRKLYTAYEAQPPVRSKLTPRPTYERRDIIPITVFADAGSTPQDPLESKENPNVRTTQDPKRHGDDSQTPTGSPPNGTSIGSGSTIAKNNSSNASTTLFLTLATGLSAIGSGITHFTDCFGDWKDWAKLGFDSSTALFGAFTASSLLKPIDDTGIHQRII